jgi:hypothetical protein
MRNSFACVGLVLGLSSLGARTEARAAASLLESPEPMIAALGARFPRDARLLNLDLRADGFHVEVQDPAVASHVDRFTFEDGVFGAPEPVQAGRSRKRLEAQLFVLADLDLTILPRLVGDAVAQARTEDGRVRSVRIERVERGTDYESWGRPVFRIVVDGPRGGAYVEYGLDGKKKDVKRW